MTLRKLCPAQLGTGKPSLKVTLSLSFALSFVLSGAFADEGYIGNNKIVIDGITYEDRDSSFSKIETVSAPGISTTYNISNSSDSYSYSEIDAIDSQYSNADGNTVIQEIGSLNGKIVVPKILCNTPSSSDCIGVYNSLMITAVGEPVSGSFYKYSPLWQKVSYDGETYYVPVDDIHHIGDISKTYNNKTESVVIGSVLVVGNGWGSFMSASEILEEQKKLNDKIIKAGKRASAITNYMNDYHNIHKYSTLDTCAHVYKNADGSVKPLVELATVLAWCNGHSVNETMIKSELKRILKENIFKHMNKHHYTDRFSELDTCKWAYWDNNGKVKPKDKLQHVLSWCDKHGVSEEGILGKAEEEVEEGEVEEEKEEFSIVDEYEVKSSDSDNADKEFIDIEVMNGTEVSKSDPNKNTYILIHGWISSPEKWAENMATTIINKEPTAQILILDWRKIAGMSLWLEEYKEGNMPMASGLISRWTKPIVNRIHQPLIDWGIERSKTTIIGHSLGTFIGLELSEKLGTVANTIYLDPAASPFDYILEFGKNPEKMDSFNTSGACFVADGSWAGSQKLMTTCKEKYLIDYSDPYDNSTVTEEVEEMALEFTIDSMLNVSTDLIKHSTIRKIVKVVDSTVVIEAVAVYEGEQTLIGSAKAIAAGKLKTLPCIATAPGGPIALAGCDAILGAVVDAVGDKIVKAAVTEHQWVYETYNEIIKHPFNDEYLTLTDIASRVSTGNIFKPYTHKKADGVIYTEEDQPKLIKYLRVRTNDDPDNYTLYGNSQSNAMECDEDKNCIMLTNGGNDEIYQTEYSKNAYVTDFNKKNDKIMLDMHGSQYLIETPSITDKSWYESGADSIGIIPLSNRQIALEGVTFGEVEGWVKVAKTGTPSKKKDNPIQIQ